MNKDHNEVWKSCLSIIRDNIPGPSFRTWFIPIQPIKLERNNISPVKVAAIKSAIDQLTGGKGEVIKIEKAS